MTTTPAPEPPAFPMTRRCPFDIPAEYRRLDDDGITRVRLPSGQLAWAVTSHAHARQLLADPRLSSRRSRPGFPRLSALPPDQAGQFDPSLLGMDPPRHTEIRRPIITEFTVKKVQRMRPRIQSIVDDHITAMLAGPKPADLITDLALPVPSLVICELLGVPYADHGFFQDRSHAFLDTALTAQEHLTALQELTDYLDKLVSRAEDNPGDDLLGRLIVKNRAADNYDHDDTVTLAWLLLLAGHETTANMIGLGTAAVLRDPDQLAELRADPSLWPGAIEEMLRYFTITDFVPSRLAVEDIEIGGLTIRAGEAVVLLTAAADRDPAAFDDPDRLDIHRGSRHHLAFGYGVHQCLGQNLARLELEVVFTTLFDRIPGLRAAGDLDALPAKDKSVIYGLESLPVTW